MTTAEFIQYCIDNPHYQVYRRDYVSGYGIPKGMLFWVPTRFIEPEDITERPLTRPEAIAYIQHLNPDLKKATINGLFRKHILTPNRLHSCNGYVYLRSEIRAVVGQLSGDK